VPGWLRRRTSPIRNVGIIPADVIVYRDGGDAVAVDGKTKEVIARSTDHAEVIQTAIANGNHIYIVGGTYEIGTSITVKNNVEIVGEYGSTVLKMADGANLIFGIFKIYYEKENVRISGLVLDGNREHQNSKSYCIAIRRSSRIIIENNIIKNAYTAGIGLYTGSGETKNNKIIIRNNVFENNKFDIYDNTYGSEDVQVVNNIFIEAEDHVIRVLNSNRWIVGKNKFILKNNGVAFVTSGAMNQIIGNTFKYVMNPPTTVYAILFGAETSADLYTEKFVISNNVIDATDITGNIEAIYLHGYDGQPTVRDGVIEGNVIVNVKYGVIATYPSHVIIVNNVIKGCDTGIRLVSCSYNKAFNNIFVNCGTGISEESAADHNEIKLNYIINSTTPITKVGANTIVTKNIGYPTEGSSVATFSGDGTTTQFKVEHGLVSAPSKIIVTPISADAKDFSYATADDTYIYFNFSTAPPSGTDNVKLSWYAEV